MKYINVYHNNFQYGGDGFIERNKKIEDKKDDLEVLPKNWEVAFTREGEQYFVDHNSGRTQWDDPRKKQKALSTSKLATYPNNNDDTGDDLPPGWEKVDDPKYGTYYIDHINRRTQYEKPEFPHKRSNSHASRIFNKTEPDPRDDRVTKKNLSIDARKLQGETFRVTMRKRAKGFGFTIVGGEQPGEVLQVNNIVRGGAADVDGRLRTGDVVMRLNGRNVLNWTHSEIIQFLQKTRVGEVVELDLVRGYALPFDPADPGVKKVGSYMPQDHKEAIRRSASNGSLVQNGNDRRGMSNRSGYLSEGEGRRPESRPESRATTPVAFRSGPPQYTVISVIRGPNGFGFTIADSPYGQRVKEIIDFQRCDGLLQGDVIIRINSTVVHNLDHIDVVETLKSCPKGQATNFQVQRSGVLTVVKTMPTPLAGKRQPPRPKSMPNFDDDEIPTAPGVRSSTSMGVIATNGETSTVNTTTYEERSHPQVSSAGDGYKSLKRAVQSNARDTDGSTNSGAGFTDYVITLQRGPGGFGFRIVGGQEEKRQVFVDNIVANGAAEKDGRIRQGDIILAVDGVNVVDASHRRVISLIGNSGLNGKVTLRIRRKNDNQGDRTENIRENLSDRGNTLPVRLMNDRGESVPSTPTQPRNHSPRDRAKSETESVNSDKHVAEWIEDQQRPRTTKPYRDNNQADGLRSKSESNLNSRPKSCPPPVAPKPSTNSTKASSTMEIILSRSANEGFGFVIMSAPTSKGSVIGRIIPFSPAARCGELSVDDKLLSVNDNDVSNMTHSEIVSMVKNSGLEVKLVLDKSVDGQNDEPIDAPPRPVVPKSYTPSYNSYNKQSDALRDEYQRQRQNLEEAKLREIREREVRQPDRPKSAPMSAHQQQNNIQQVTITSHASPYQNSISSEDRATIKESARLRMNPGDVEEVILQRGERGFGFSIRGGEGMPLFVLKIADSGPAYEDGRIKVGDEILEINGENTEYMSHAVAVNTIKNCLDKTALLIRRPIKPIVTEEERVPNGYNNQHDIPREAQFDRPRSGYY